MRSGSSGHALHDVPGLCQYKVVVTHVRLGIDKQATEIRRLSIRIDKVEQARRCVSPWNVNMRAEKLE